MGRAPLSRAPWIAGCALFFAATLAEGARALPGVEFVLPESSEVETSEGTLQLAWQIPGAAIGSTDFNFEIQRATDVAFSSTELYYTGPENGTFISGLPAGDFYFRVRTVGTGGGVGPWSQRPIHVIVKYASAGLVTTLMLIGTVVFIATVLVVIKGHKNAGRSTLVAPKV